MEREPGSTHSNEVACHRVVTCLDRVDMGQAQLQRLRLEVSATGCGGADWASVYCVRLTYIRRRRERSARTLVALVCCMVEVVAVEQWCTNQVFEEEMLDVFLVEEESNEAVC